MPRVKPHVELVACTPDMQTLIAMAAKVCYSASDIKQLKNKIQKEDQEAFIQNLMDMGHMSPVEHASFTFAIEGVSRTFLAQITRHRLASFSVQSQRYVSMRSEETFDYVLPERIEALGAEMIQKFHNQMRTMQNWYNEWLDLLEDSGNGAKEDARFVLPGASATRMLMTMNVRELNHFFSLRCCNRAQWEIRQVAWEMLRLCKKEAPFLFKEAGPSCLKGACTQGKMSCGRAQQMRQKAKEIDDGLSRE